MTHIANQKKRRNAEVEGTLRNGLMLRELASKLPYSTLAGGDGGLYLLTREVVT